MGLYEIIDLPQEEEDTELMTMPVSSTSSSESILDMYEDTGDINLVMRILARMCDGQYREIQVRSGVKSHRHRSD